MIRLRHVSKLYPASNAGLKDISLHIEKGEFAFVTGPSGAGKTTLLRLLLREELATEGSIIVNGRNVTTMPRRDVPYLRRTMGVVFQDFKLIQGKTVLENLTFVQEAVGIPRSAHVPRAMKVLKQVSLQHRINALPAQLSGGEQQRVAVARALVNEPIILLADEPTGNLDDELAAEIMKLLREINAHGTTVIVATPKEAKVASAVKNMPAIATRTVEPETSTDRPEVAAAASNAASSLRPAARSSRSRFK